jgi:hypothetical protein
MVIVDSKSGVLKEVDITRVEQVDYKRITKSRFWFDWKEEKPCNVSKLCLKGTDDILGLVSLDVFPSESRIEIRLLAVSIENRGKAKNFSRIAGNLIAFACIESIKNFGEMACISLVPKTELIQHYIDGYGMLPAGKSLFLDGNELLQLIKNYDHDYERK